MSQKNKVDRRQFLKKTGAVAGGAIAFPYFVPASALGRDGSVSPSERITVGLIGAGERGKHVTKYDFLTNPKAQMVAACDTATWRVKEGVALIDETYGSKGCAGYADFRELLADPGIDAVFIATPDHWHTPLSVYAAKAGKDVYSEKPVTLTIEQGNDLRDVMKQTGRIYQSGTQGRSDPSARRACELVRNGRIGDLVSIDVYLPPSRGIEEVNAKNPAPSAEPVPDGFDYDLWLGPAPWRPYMGGCFWMFRYISDYSGGYITDWGTHQLDFAQWLIDADGSGPISVEGKGQRMTGGLYDVYTKYDIEYVYANGVKVTMQESPGGNAYLHIKGTEGWFNFNWDPSFADSSNHIEKMKIGPDEIHVYESDNHADNFLNCIATRQQTIAPPDVGHRSATMCHMAIIAMDLGKKLDWDPVSERFTNSDVANRLRSRPMRSPWHL
jgi:predicted dehydrogenase